MRPLVLTGTTSPYPTVDIVTMAKGLTSCYLPLGAMGMRQAIADHFKAHVFYGGLTYNSHPSSLAAAEACIHVLRDEGMIDNAAQLEPVMREEMQALQDKHPSVKAFRVIGLFGIIDLQRDSAGGRLAPYGHHSKVGDAFKKRLLELGLYTYVRWSEFMCIPPLCITEEELRHAFSIIDEALELVDEAFEG